MKYLKTYEEVNESRFTRGLATAALAGTLACTTPSCVKNNAQTIRIEHPELSPNKGDFKPGEEVNIEIPPHSNVKKYTITLSAPDKTVLRVLEGELDGPNGVTESYRIPLSYSHKSIELTMTGEDKLGREFTIRRIISLI